LIALAGRKPLGASALVISGWTAKQMATKLYFGQDPIQAQETTDLVLERPA
jgi:hypothetical protein